MVLPFAGGGKPGEKLVDAATHGITSEHSGGGLGHGPQGGAGIVARKAQRQSKGADLLSPERAFVSFRTLLPRARKLSIDPRLS